MATSVCEVTKVSDVTVWATDSGGIEISLLTPRGQAIAELSLDADQARVIAVQVLEIVANELTGYLGFQGADMKMREELTE